MVYLIDNIGTETGMHYYDRAFVDFMYNNDVSTKIISNYKSNQVHLVLPNYFKGGFFTKIVSLIRFYFSYLIVVFRKIKSNQIIFQSFGMSFIEILFIIPFASRDNFIVIIHDLRNIQKQNKFACLQNYIYKRLRNLIIHNEDIVSPLYKIGFKGNLFYVPHFHMNTKQGVTGHSFANKIGADLSEIKKKTNSIKVLFFGTIRHSKGIDILMNSLVENVFEGFEFFIAGNDKYDLLREYKEILSSRKNIHFINRYIEDEELDYLFSIADFTILPYKEIFQSGVLEVAVNYKLPVILSNAKYFESFLSNYPSFGILIRDLTPNGIKNVLSQTFGKKNQDFYDTHELRKFYKTTEFDSFIIEFKKHFRL